MRSSSNAAIESIASFLGGVVGLAVAIWVTWCVVIGFIGGELPLTGYYTEGSLGGGIVILFAMSIVGAIVGTIAYWVCIAIITLIYGLVWTGEKVVGAKKPFMDWSDDELLACITNTYLSFDESEDTTESNVRAGFVFHQDPGQLPRKIVRNTVKRYGEFSPYLAFEVDGSGSRSHFDDPFYDGPSMGWSSHDCIDSAIQAASKYVGANGRQVGNDDPVARRFHEFVFSAIRRPWEWE